MSPPNSIRILAIDPGNDTGWSAWEGAGLLRCGLGLPPVWPADIVVIEVPQIYPGGPKINQNDLATLAINVGRHIQRLAELCPWRTTLGFFPKTWKGTLTKEVHHNQVKQRLGALRTLAESDMRSANIPKGKQHNTWDAVGLGHWVVSNYLVGENIGGGLKALTALADHRFCPL